jgi:hypothetical protein
VPLAYNRSISARKTSIILLAAELIPWATAVFQICSLKEQVRSITARTFGQQSGKRTLFSASYSRSPSAPILRSFNQGGTEIRRRTNLHGIVPALKSSGADSSVLTAGVPQGIGGNLVRTLGTACGCADGVKSHPLQKRQRMGHPPFFSNLPSR